MKPKKHDLSPPKKNNLSIGSVLQALEKNFQRLYTQRINLEDEKNKIIKYEKDVERRR